MKSVKFLFSTIVFLSILSEANATTYKATMFGRWTSSEIWTPSFPGNIISEKDSVIIEADVVINANIEVYGTLLVKKRANLIGNFPIYINKSGLYQNQGNSVYKNIINAGIIENEMLIETNSDIENEGSVYNNKAIVSAATIYNNGGVLDGNKGAYYAKDKFVNTNNGIVGEKVKMYIAENNNSNIDLPTIAATKNKINLQGELYSRNNISLTVLTGGVKVVQYKIEKSTDGKNYISLPDYVVADNAIEYKIYEEKDAQPGNVWFRVRAIANDIPSGYLPIVTMHIE